MVPAGPVRPPTRLVLLIAASTVIPLGGLLWAGWHLYQQDRQISAGLARQRLEQSTEVVIAALQRALAGSEQRLVAGSDDWPAGAVAVTFEPHAVRLSDPGRLAYLPVPAAQQEVPREVFAEGEALEFRQGGLQAAVEHYRGLTRSPRLPVRAGALLRLARTLQKSGRTQEALDSYEELTGIQGVSELGFDVGLAAIHERARLFARDGRAGELTAEAARLQGELTARRGALSASQYQLFADDVQEWTGRRPDALLEAYARVVTMLWDDWRGGRVAGSAPARRIVHADGLWLVVCWQPTVSGARALLAAPRFVEAEWLGPVLQLAADQHVAVALGDPMRQAVDLQGLEPWPASDARRGDAAVVRGHLQAELPWNVLVRSRAGIEDDAVRSRWRLLGAGFLLLVLIAGAASALVIRAVTRELAVARLESDFVAAVSHEFRTPLTTLRQFTEMLREQPHLPEPRRVLCYDAQARATDRLTRLVESVLDFGRLEAGAERYHIQPTDGADLVGRITAEFRSESQGSGHEIVFVPDGATPIECDRHALGRAVRNLLDNATKYSPEKTRIDVTVRHAGTSVQIAVRDRGLGIPPHEHGAIFAKFQRGGEARMRGIRGTGLGLAMVRQIVEAHGGRVDVASRPGEGSTFTIVLPAAGPSLEIAGAQIGEGSPAQT